MKEYLLENRHKLTTPLSILQLFHSSYVDAVEKDDADYLYRLDEIVREGLNITSAELIDIPPKLYVVEVPPRYTSIRTRIYDLRSQVEDAVIKRGYYSSDGGLEFTQRILDFVIPNLEEIDSFGLSWIKVIHGCTVEPVYDDEEDIRYLEYIIQVTKKYIYNLLHEYDVVEVCDSIVSDVVLTLKAVVGSRR